MGLTYHATPKAHWDESDVSQPYVSNDFSDEGFIHCTDSAEGLPSVLTTYYKDEPGEWIVLTIDKDRVKSPVRYEDLENIFPHIYGPLNRDAIVEFREFARSDDGTYLPLATRAITVTSRRACASGDQ